jgi:hypothetical protein
VHSKKGANPPSGLDLEERNLSLRGRSEDFLDIYIYIYIYILIEGRGLPEFDGAAEEEEFQEEKGRGRSRRGGRPSCHIRRRTRKEV